MHFKSVEDMGRLADSLMALATSERIQWEYAHHFVSFATAQDSVIRLLEEACDSDEFNRIVYENPQFLKFTSNGNVEHISLPASLRYVINKDGLVCFNDNYHWITEKNMVATQATNLAMAKKNFAENREVRLLTNFSNHNTIHKKSTGCGTNTLSDDRLADKRYVKVTLINQLIEIKETSCCVKTYQEVSIEIVGKKPNIWGKYYTYPTTHSYSGLELIFDRLDIVYAPYDCRNKYGCPTRCDAAGFIRTHLKFPDYEGPEEEVFNKILFKSKIIYNTPVDVNRNKFFAAKVKAWTRGTNPDNYAAICCNWACEF